MIFSKIELILESLMKSASMQLARVTTIIRVELDVMSTLDNVNVCQE